MYWVRQQIQPTAVAGFFLNTFETDLIDGFHIVPLFSSVTVYFIDRDNEKREARAKLGSNLLDVAIDNGIDLEGFG